MQAAILSSMAVHLRHQSSLTEANLNGATVTVSLGGLTYASGVSASSFALVNSPVISGLSPTSPAARRPPSPWLHQGLRRPGTLAVRVLAGRALRQR